MNKTNLAYEPPDPQGEVVQFPKRERQAMSEKFDKGYVMSSRLYRNEVEPFLSDAASRVYARLENYLIGFNKESDFISYSQLQGDKKLIGSRILSRATVAKALKELNEFGVISVIGTNKKIGNRYKINEVSLVQEFTNKTNSESKLVQKLNSSGLESEPVGSLETKHTIDIIYRYLIIDKNINSLRSNRPLQNHFFVYQENQKLIILEQQKLASAEQLKAEKERKDKVRKLGFDEVMKLTKNTFANLCDLELWEQYVSNRSQQAKTKLTKNALNTIYKDFIEWGYEGSNQSLKTSITGNYQGLFAPKQPSNTYQAKAAKQAQTMQKHDDFFAQYGIGSSSQIVDVVSEQVLLEGNQ